ncbi:MAG: hypothetical protein HDR09_18000 [Lachnospiraceae bacterium]|nr:hypothetical protein [Lachnospiraceae bacterium]
MDDMKPIINVLWIDDLEDQLDGGESFMTRAETKHNIIITNRQTVDEGIIALRNPAKHYDAIILDINCRRNKETDGVVTYKSLSYAIQKLSEYRINIPYFVYSALAEIGPTLVDVVVTQDRSYDTKSLYNKPADRELLFENIKRVVFDWPDFKIKNRYADAFGIVPDGKLLELLKHSETEGFENSSNVPKLMRPLLESLAHHFDKHHMIRLNAKKIPNLDGDGISKHNHSKDLSFALGSDKENKYVPTHVQRTLHFLSECANEGCHSYNDIEAPYKIPYLLENGYAKYLNKHMVLGLLNVLAWANTLPFESGPFIEQWREYFKLN